MKRPLLVALIGYIIGIIWELYLKINIAPFIVILIVITFFCKKSYKLFIVIIISMLVSSTQVNYLNKKYSNLYIDLKENSKFTGIVTSDKKEGEYYNTYTVKILEVNDCDRYKNTKLIIKTKKKLLYGEKIEFYGTYKKAEVSRNFMGFNYSIYLRTQGIYGICEDIGNVISKEKTNNIEVLFHNFSLKIKEKITLLLEKEEAGILLAFITGDTSLISDDIKENFRDSGVYHILAISGMHMTYVILIIDKIIKKLNINRKYKKVIQILSIIAFMNLTTRSISIVRAGIMAIISIFAIIIDRRSDTVNNISISMLILLIFNPYSVNNISFQLSYGGVIGIVALEKKYEKIMRKFNIKEKISKIISPILSAQTILLPITILNFHTISLTFLIANLLSGFIVGVIIIIGFITLVLSFVSMNLSIFISKILSISIKLLLLITRYSSLLLFSKIYVIRPKFYIVILYYLIILKITVFKDKWSKEIKRILYVIRKRRLYLIAICIVIIIFYIPKNLKIYFIDVGQGDSTLIITPKNKTILIDSGGSQNKDYDIGKKVLLPYLLDRGVYRLDYAIISHFDTDHVGGLLTVMEKMDIGTIIISKQVEDTENYQRFKEIVKKKKTKVIYVEVNDRNSQQKLNIEKDLYFYVLWPDNSKIITENVLNNNSIVCKLYYKKFSMLFTGDIEEIAEKKILQEYRNNKHILNSTILKVAHHGSKTSSTKKFIEEVKPKIALIGVGENNKFGHPSNEVIQRLKENGAKIYRTDKMGEVSISVDNKGRIKIKKFIE